MQRLALALALIATALFHESSTAQAEIGSYPLHVVGCEPMPPGYPRGWELMVRRPCLLDYGHVSYYEPARYYRPLVATYPYHPALHVGYGIHRRPYLRHGWWW